MAMTRAVYVAALRVHPSAVQKVHQRRRRTGHVDTTCFNHTGNPGHRSSSGSPQATTTGTLHAKVDDHRMRSVALSYAVACHAVLSADFEQNKCRQ